MCQLFVSVIYWYFIQFEVIYKSKESFKSHMLVFILDSVKTHIFASFKDVGTVMLENLL